MKSIIITIILILVVLVAFFYLKKDSRELNLDSAPSSTIAQPSVIDKVVVPDNGVLYTLVFEESSLSWFAERIAGANHNGKVNISQGIVAMLDNNAVAGAFVIDMNSISESNGNSILVSHLKTDDFFSVDKYPYSSFEITKFEPINNTEQTTNETTATHMITGNLTIKNITKEIIFPTTIKIEGNKITAESSITVDRLKWDITYDSGNVFKELGDKAIKDEIKLELKLVVENQENQNDSTTDQLEQ